MSTAKHFPSGSLQDWGAEDVLNFLNSTTNIRRTE